MDAHEQRFCMPAAQAGEGEKVQKKGETGRKQVGSAKLLLRILESHIINWPQVGFKKHENPFVTTIDAAAVPIL